MNDQINSRYLLHLFDDVATSGVAFDDERVGYVEVQIDRATWKEIQAISSALTSTHTPTED